MGCVDWTCHKLEKLALFRRTLFPFQSGELRPMEEQGPR